MTEPQETKDEQRMRAKLNAKRPPYACKGWGDPERHPKPGFEGHCPLCRKGMAAQLESKMREKDQG